MRGRCGTFAVLVGVAVLTAACMPPTETPSAPTTSTTPSAALETGPSVVAPLLASVIASPIPVPATDDMVHLAYELLLTNVLNHELTLTSLDVRASDKTLLNLAGDRLAKWARLFGNPTPTRKLGPAQSAAVWLDGRIASMAAGDAIEAGQPAPMQPAFTSRDESAVSPLVLGCDELCRSVTGVGVSGGR